MCCAFYVYETSYATKEADNKHHYTPSRPSNEVVTAMCNQSGLVYNNWSGAVIFVILGQNN